MSLPAQVVFSIRESDIEQRYLSFTGPHRQLRCGLDEDVFSDIARFAVEPAGDGLVHIRSTYENYYWTRASRFEPWLSALAPEKVEDMSNDECTLFRPRISAGNTFVRFTHVQSGMNVVVLPGDDAHGYNLCLEYDAATEFSYIDYAVLIRTKLPRYVMFLGNNYRYMRAKNVTGNSGYLNFQLPDNRSREVGFEVFYNKSGDNLRIKSMSINEFWCALPPDKRVLISPLPEFHPSTLFDAATSFSPPDNARGIAFRSLVYDQYCERSERGEMELVIGAKSPNEIKAWITPRYLAISGKSHVNIESFRHAWTGPKSSRILRFVPFINTEFQEKEYTISIRYRALMRRAFVNSIPIIREGNFVFNGRIPQVGSTGELEVPDVAEDITDIWDASRLFESIKEEDIKLIIPPRSGGDAALTLYKAAYRVPFSYQQINEFPFGGTGTQHLHDGVYSIENEYGVGFSNVNIWPIRSDEEVLDKKIYTDLRALELEGINAVDDDGVEPNANDEVNQE